MPLQEALPLAGATVRSPAPSAPLAPLDEATAAAEASMAPPPPKPLMGAARASLPSPVSDVAAGRIAAVTTAPFDATNVPPLMSQLLKIGVPALEEAGLSLFETAKSETVFYNASKVDEATLKQAEQNGTLYEIAPPIGTAAPSKGQAAPAPAQMAAPMSTPSSPNFKAPPASLQTQMATARTNVITNPAGGRPMSPVAPNPLTSRLGARTV